MVVVKTPPRRTLPETLKKELHSLRDALPDYHKTDLADLRTFFRLGGVASPVLA